MSTLTAWKSIFTILIVLTASFAAASNFTNIYNFDDPYTVPGSLIQGIDGNLYGATTGELVSSRLGTIFRLSPEGALSVLYTFCSQPNCADGYDPSIGALVQDVNGNLYGATSLGGDEQCFAPYGCGVLFKLAQDGTFTVLHTFEGPDGSSPNAGMIEGIDGNFYGTTGGGANGLGAVFKLTPAGGYSIVHSFSGTDGSSPNAGLIQMRDGSFYGTTNFGGSNTCASGGCGTVFKMSPAGLVTTLHAFTSSEGQEPLSGLALGNDGNFYGTTSQGGSPSCVSGCGTVYKITPAGTLTTLHSFDRADGNGPLAGLTAATDGRFYGVAETGGTLCKIAGGCGTLFRINSAGTFTLLLKFTPDQGENPTENLMQDTSGSFYGTTLAGGDISCGPPVGCGTAFSFEVGLGPFARLMRNLGRTGQTIGIFGQGFTGATAVSFNGAAATFSVHRDTFLVATVPAGATSGYVTVTTPDGTLQSNVRFQVVP